MESDPGPSITWEKNNIDVEKWERKHELLQ